MSETVDRRLSRHHPYLPTALIGVVMTVAVVASTIAEVPESAEGRATAYVILGVISTALATLLSQRTQVRIERHQRAIQKFLTERVNSRPNRTKALIEICATAETQFRAVTYFPVVGIRDSPDTAPLEYLNTLESCLRRGVEVVLVSISCADARKYCEENGFNDKERSIRALARVETRLAELLKFFSSNLTVITVPASAITVNVCHSESSALMYYMCPDDHGAGFRSEDPLVLAVAKGGVDRYASYSDRNGGGPAAD